MKIYNLFYREYWQEIYEDTHMGCFSTVDLAIANAKHLIKFDESWPREAHPFTAYYIYEEVLDQVGSGSSIGEMLVVMDSSGRVFYRKGEIDSPTLIPPEYDSTQFPSIAGK